VMGHQFLIAFLLSFWSKALMCDRETDGSPPGRVTCAPHDYQRLATRRTLVAASFYLSGPPLWGGGCVAGCVVPVNTPAFVARPEPAALRGALSGRRAACQTASWVRRMAPGGARWHAVGGKGRMICLYSFVPFLDAQRSESSGRTSVP
jgi:hypothetical protein